MLEILYEDNHLLIINKPAGMLTQGDATGDLSLLEIAKTYLKEKYRKPGAVYLSPAHRLDRPVSGALIFARTDKAAARLAAQFRERGECGTLEKIYLAGLNGRLAARIAEVKKLENPLVIGGKNARTRVMAAPVTASKNAVLLYQIIAVNKAQSLVTIKLLTGYKHQIRAQFAAIGAPLIGDFKYAPKTATPLNDGHAIGLHALKITVLHPTKKTPLTIFAPPPAYFSAWIRGWTAVADFSALTFRPIDNPLP